MRADQANVPTQSQNDILINRVVSNNKLESVKDEKKSKDICIYPKTLYIRTCQNLEEKFVFCRTAFAKYKHEGIKPVHKKCLPQNIRGIYIQ